MPESSCEDGLNSSPLPSRSPQLILTRRCEDGRPTIDSRAHLTILAEMSDSENGNESRAEYLILLLTDSNLPTGLSLHAI